MKNDCIDCYKIICRGCGWEPNANQLVLVQNGTLTVCPDCGWKPGNAVSNMNYE